MKKKKKLTIISIAVIAVIAIVALVVTLVLVLRKKDGGQENSCNHNYIESVTPPTCTEQGFTLHTCSVCGDNYKDTYVDAKHNYITSVTAPTCTEQGYTLHTCSACGDNYKDTYVDARHNYITSVTAPTCTEQGYTLHTCSACGDNYQDTLINATGHSEVIDSAVEATCYSEGKTQGSHCQICDTVITAQTKIEVLSHNYGSNHLCTYCFAVDSSIADTKGLDFTYNYSTKTYKLTGIIDSNTETAIKIPGTYKGAPVTEIGAEAFQYHSEIQGVYISENITTIEQYAFYSCQGLKSVTLPNSLTAINKSAFALCYELEYIKLPDNLTSFGETAFSTCRKLKEFSIPDKITSLPNNVLSNCISLKKLSLGSGVSSIDQDALLGCQALEEIIVSADNSVFSSYDGVLYNKKQTYVYFVPQALKGDITIPQTVFTISQTAQYKTRLFSGRTQLTDITILSNLDEIGYETFSGCTLLKTVTIKGNISTIQSNAFKNCSALTTINFNGTMEEWNALTKRDGWDNGTGDYTVHCTDGKLGKDGNVIE